MPPRIRSVFRKIKWSEPIIVLGEGIDHPSKKYRTLTHCIAGIGEESGWIRLYPVLSSNTQTFDVIQVAIRNEHPEKIRPESRKIRVSFSPKIVGRIRDEKMRIELLEKHLDQGKFLHDDSWKGRKTLGLIQPIYPEFEVNWEEKQVKVKFKCNAPECLGHKCEVLDAHRIDRFGERKFRAPLKKIEPKLVKLHRDNLLGRNQLWFIMGTVYRHPQRWIVVETHVVEGMRKIQRLRSFLENSII